MRRSQVCVGSAGGKAGCAGARRPLASALLCLRLGWCVFPPGSGYLRLAPRVERMSNCAGRDEGNYRVPTKVEAPTMYKIPQSPDVTFSQRSRAANRWTCLGTRRTRVPSETRARCHPCTCPTSRLRKPRPTRRRVSASTAGAAATRSDALGRAEHVHLQQRCCRSRLVRARKERGASGLVGLLELERRGSTSSAMSMVSEAILRLCPSTNAFAR